ncbi:hypothetical protein V8E52_011627 [Russula decolorans]
MLYQVTFRGIGHNEALIHTMNWKSKGGLHSACGESTVSLLARDQGRINVQRPQIGDFSFGCAGTTNTNLTDKATRRVNNALPAASPLPSVATHVIGSTGTKAASMAASITNWSKRGLFRVHEWLRYLAFGTQATWARPSIQNPPKGAEAPILPDLFIAHQGASFIVILLPIAKFMSERAAQSEKSSFQKREADVCEALKPWLFDDGQPPPTIPRILDRRTWVKAHSQQPSSIRRPRKTITNGAVLLAGPGRFEMTRWRFTRKSLGIVVTGQVTGSSIDRAQDTAHSSAQVVAQYRPRDREYVSAHPDRPPRFGIFPTTLGNTLELELERLSFEPSSSVPFFSLLYSAVVLSSMKQSAIVKRDKEIFMPTNVKTAPSVTSVDRMREIDPVIHPVPLQQRLQICRDGPAPLRNYRNKTESSELLSAGATMMM